MGKSAVEPAHKALAHTENILRNLTGVHNVGGKNEQRHSYKSTVGKNLLNRLLRHQMETSRFAHQRRADGLAGSHCTQKKIRHAGGDHPGGDGHPQYKNQDKYQKKTD